MGIIRQEDIVNGGEIVMITGTVDRIIIKEAEQTAKNIEFGVTHIASIVVADQWINFISLGIKEGKEPNIAINTGTKDSPKWVQIQETDEVKVVVKETVKGDKTYYNAKRTGIKLVKKNATPGQAPQHQASGGSTNYTAKPKDMSGIEAGQSLNGAMNFILTYGVDASNESIVSYGKKVHSATVKVKESYKKDNPAVPEYDAGARCGLAILTACKLVGTEVDFEQGIIDLAQDILNNVLEPITEFVKTPQASAAPAKVTRAPVKKPAATKAKPVVEEEVFPELDEEDASSLPF